MSDLNQILLQLYNGTGHDFSLYKKSTIGRRIERRMMQHNIRDLGGYACYLKEHPLEVQRLFKQLLINVTSFFRNPEAFVALKREVLPKLLADKPTDYVLRVWVAACSTGEEAYSIAMLLREFMDESHKEFGIQIYATDINNDAIDVARTGSYPLSIVQDVTSERLHRFFIKDDDDAGYKVKKDIRDMVVFAVQSVIKHPPFAELDLFSCRNLLIYLGQEQQNRLITTFHHALKPGGVLFLSPSENIANRSNLFSVLNHKWKLYQVNHTATVSPTLSKSFSRMNNVGRIPDMGMISETKADNIANLSKRILLRSYAPASVTTDIKGNILYMYGDTGKYLRPPSATAINNVIEMAHEGLQLELRAALLNAVTENEPTLNRVVSVKTNDGFSQVSFSARLLPGHPASEIAGESLLLISFQETAGSGTKQGRGQRSAALAEAELVGRLEHVLAYTRESLQAAIEEQQMTNEELQSANEELQSANEELQSSNEELKISKDELQSSNEKTIIVNTELTAYIEAIGKLALVSITDRSGRILQANAKFCEVSGYSEQELIGQNHRILNSGTHSKEFFVKMWATIARGEV